MIHVKKIVVSAFMLTALSAAAQDTPAKSEAQKVKDSVKMDVRHLGKVTTTTTTTTRRTGYRKKKNNVKPVADSLIVKETMVNDDSLMQHSMPVIEADKVKNQ